MGQLRTIGHTCAWMSLFLALQTPAAAQVCIPPPSDILGWWPLNETSGSIAFDLDGEHPAAFFNSPGPVAGEVDGALHFDGTSFLSAADSDLWAFGGRSFTIELWAKFDV